MARQHRRKSWHRLRSYLPKILAGIVTAAVLAGGVYFITKKTPEDYLKAGIELHQKGDSKGAAIELRIIFKPCQIAVKPAFCWAAFILPTTSFRPRRRN